MLEKKVSAIAVIDEKGQLEGNISVSDLRGLAASDLGSLLTPVKHFLKVYRCCLVLLVLNDDHSTGEIPSNRSRDVLRVHKPFHCGQKNR